VNSLFIFGNALLQYFNPEKKSRKPGKACVLSFQKSTGECWRYFCRGFRKTKPLTKSKRRIKMLGQFLLFIAAITILVTTVHL
jgi:hypothetical protein